MVGASPREHDNLFAAMAFALDAHDVEHAFTLLCKLPLQRLQVDDVVVFDPEAILALPDAHDHPGSAVALVLTANAAAVRDEREHAVELCDLAIAAERRLGPTPGWPLDMASSEVRAIVPASVGALEEVANHYIEAAARARAADLPTMAALYLGLAAGTLAWQDARAGQRYAADGLELARHTGAPNAIVYNLLALAVDAGRRRSFARPLAARRSDPHARRRGVREPEPTDDRGYSRRPASALWTTTLRCTSRALHHHLRSGAIPTVTLAGLFNLTARGLADHLPERAAVIQGAVRPLLTRQVTSTGVAPRASSSSVGWPCSRPRSATTPPSSSSRSSATRTSASSRAEGVAMDETAACRYSRAHIDGLLARGPDPLA